MLCWKDDYALGINKIDEQHKELFKLGDKVLTLNPEALRQKDYMPDKEEIKNVLHQLYDYVKIHFNDEETFMENVPYPELTIYKKHHEKIIEEVNRIIKKKSKIT